MSRQTYTRLLTIFLPIVAIQGIILLMSPKKLVINNSLLNNDGIETTNTAPFHLWPKSRQAIYLPGNISLNKDILKQIKNSGFNAIIFDIKGGDGYLLYQSQTDMAKKLKNSGTTFPNLADQVKYLHEQGFTVIARQVLFWDNLLSKNYPEYRVKNQYSPAKKQNWVDPSLAAVWDYNLVITKEVAGFGVDEIQYDYIRFPVDTLNNVFAFDGKKYSRADIIANFLKKSRTEIDTIDPQIKIGIDIFGIAPWDDNSAKKLGQEVNKLAPFVDAIYPMVYSSHFHNGFDGYKNPADYPEYFVGKTMEKLKKQLCPPIIIDSSSTAPSPADQQIIYNEWRKKAQAKIMPWLQGFSLKVSNYGPDYIVRQIKTANQFEVNNFAFWNNGEIDTIIQGLKKYKTSAGAEF